MAMHIGHFAQRVTDLDPAADHLIRVLGLRVRERDDSQVLLTSNDKHHEVQLILDDRPGFDHLGLEVESEDELARVQAAAEAFGARILGSSQEPGIAASVRIASPADLLVDVYVGMERDAPCLATSPLRSGIRKLGHLTFMSEARDELERFWREALGFRVSDIDGPLTWLRCDADHHGLAVGPSPAGSLLHHHAWEVQDMSALAKHADAMARQDIPLVWGPVRHGPGFNLSTYLETTGGGLIEVCCDLARIDDEASYRPMDWSANDRSINLWGPPPPETFLAYGTPVLPPVGAAEVTP
jgi:catechol 2,3-dioxygenase